MLNWKNQIAATLLAFISVNPCLSVAKK